MDDLIHHEYSVGLPEGWQDKTEVVLSGPMNDGTCPTLTVTRIRLKVEQTLEQFAAYQLHGLGVQMAVKKTDILEEGETTLGGLPAFARVYNLRFFDKPLMQRQTYVVRGLVAYVVTETSTVDQFEDDRPLFNEMLKRFQFRLPAA
ncbi:MAG: DUF1795 domain-containing protein [Polyangiaceae bacterium]|nr:DUF1795 domain-containing protein [Polyangiaceae bacterium]